MEKLYYDHQKRKWYAVPEEKEVVAYMPYPKPYLKEANNEKRRN